MKHAAKTGPRGRVAIALACLLSAGCGAATHEQTEAMQMNESTLRTTSAAPEHSVEVPARAGFEPRTELDRAAPGRYHTATFALG